jgi:hypothetical protein
MVYRFFSTIFYVIFAIPQPVRSMDAVFFLRAPEKGIGG